MSFNILLIERLQQMSAEKKNLHYFIFINFFFLEQILLSFLNPGANRMQTQIMEVLDMDLIRQQADNDAVDIQGLASYIITTMSKMCAPLRDEEIKKLRELNTDNTVTLFR